MNNGLCVVNICYQITFIKAVLVIDNISNIKDIGGVILAPPMINSFIFKSNMKPQGKRLIFLFICPINCLDSAPYYSEKAIGLNVICDK